MNEVGTPTKSNVEKNESDETAVAYSSPSGNESDDMSNPQGVNAPPTRRNVSEIVSEEPNASREDRRRKTRKDKNIQNPSEWKRRKRGRRVRLAKVNDSNVYDVSFPPLPSNQYKTILRRRAIRKKEEGIDENDDPEDYGDISLGMKLIVVRGRVIVQSLNELSDGRASPAQLTGVIQRGDVLLAIENLSLVHLPIDQLLDGLKPLSAPGPDGKYTRILDLRFEAGAGFELLKSHEKTEEDRKENLDAANEVFNLFPMVDQLSGTPLFEDHEQLLLAAQETPKSLKRIAEGDEEDEAFDDKEGQMPTLVDRQQSRDEIISSVLAEEKKVDHERFASEFFNLSDNLPELLKKAIQEVEESIQEEIVTEGMTQAERVDLGKTIMKLTKSLSLAMEDIDKGKDLRSFKTWSSNFSLRSSASARRRYVLDTASLRSQRTPETGAIDEESVGSDGSGGSLGDVDGDALLLGLAAHDDIWRKQVLDFLEQSVTDLKNKKIDEDEEEEETSNEEKEDLPDIDSALSKEFGAFLFGTSMTKIMTKKKKSPAIPSEEITTVLFDLITNIATSAPDEITVFGQSSANPSFQSDYATPGKAKSALRASTLLANQFVLDNALPLWLQSFQPFSWEQRRVLWPRMARLSTTAAGTNVSDGDSLTMESFGSSPITQSKTKDLREIIEDQELDIETRSETCFLVTYYFTEKLLAQYPIGVQSEENSSTVDEEAVAFVKKYGAYLQLHSCLSSSAAVKAEAPIQEILLLANHDPSHRDAVKEIQRANKIIFYDTVKLSAVLTLLQAIQKETKIERRDIIRSMCISAYPDIQPWQVRQACYESERGSKQVQQVESWLEDFYYSYLSQLLHPNEGNEAARHNKALVKEWCQWSIGLNPFDATQAKSTDLKRQENFFLVASRSSGDHVAYRRDLEVLLKLSMVIEEHDLALDLATEILDNRRLLSQSHISTFLLENLKVIGSGALSIATRETEQDAGFRILKRVLRLFNQMSSSDSSSCRESIIVANELFLFLQEWKEKVHALADDEKMFILIDYIITESSPSDVFPALVEWSSVYQVGDSLLPRLNTLIRQGVHVALQSGKPSLFQLQQARRTYSQENKILSSGKYETENSEDGIWKRMSKGYLSINK